MTTQETFSDAPRDPLRLARWLSAKNPRELSAQHRLAYALRANDIARGDIALELLREPDDSNFGSDIAAAQIKSYIDLMRLDEGNDAISRYKQKHGPDCRLLKLEFAAARAAGKSLPEGIDAKSFAEIFANASLSELNSLLPAIPFAHLPAAFVARATMVTLRRDMRFGLRLFARWLGAVAMQILSLFLAAITFAGLRLLNPGRAVYIAELPKFTRMAHLICWIDPLLRKLASAEGGKRHRLYVLYFGGYPNLTLLELYKRHCAFVEAKSKITRKLAYTLSAALRRTGKLSPSGNFYRVLQESMQKYPALLRFEAREASNHAARLEKMGIDVEKRFILFGLRDMAYYRFYGNVQGIPMNARRASTHHRCPSLQTYASAAQFWAQSGHQVLRVGLRVSEALPPGLDARVIDYASGERDDALDAFLFSKCWFMICGDTGLYAGAAAFDRPSVLSDASIIEINMFSSCKDSPNIYVPALFRDLKTDAFLSFREAIYHNYEYQTAEACENADVQLIHNSVEDLLDASRELAARLDGRYEESPEDRERQRAFHAVYQPSHNGYGSTALVSAAFLRKHEALLDVPARRSR